MNGVHVLLIFTMPRSLGSDEQESILNRFVKRDSNKSHTLEWGQQVWEEHRLCIEVGITDYIKIPGTKSGPKREQFDCACGSMAVVLQR